MKNKPTIKCIDCGVYTPFTFEGHCVWCVPLNKLKQLQTAYKKERKMAKRQKKKATSKKKGPVTITPIEYDEIKPYPIVDIVDVGEFFIHGGSLCVLTDDDPVCLDVGCGEIKDISEDEQVILVDVEIKWKIRK